MSPKPDALATADPVEKLAKEMAAAWRRGECLRVEHYLNRHPELSEQPEGAVRLIYEELCLRQERGEEAPVEELLHRFPRWTSELSVLLDCHRLLEARLAPPQFPAVGESLGDFRLVAELGRGRHGRVFLAMQPTLADRPVVLKVTPRQDREFLSLARLQHTHIIPLHGVHDFPTRNVRALCQPYHGGATLARLLELLAPLPVARRTGQFLVQALDRAGRESPLALPPTGRPREALSRASYVEAICWIGACLADGLQYAHERGLVHLDLKPSNVLLAADGQPLLLDFHLALQPLAAGRAVPEWFGGTPEYMSPEQAQACDAGCQGRFAPLAVDGRSDVYSLGRLLYVALTGKEELGTISFVPLHRRNPQVSVGLSDLIARCLAINANDRYPDAASVAADLRRHLTNLPLRGVPNRSLREHWHKWRRRQPQAPLFTGFLLALTAGGALLLASAVERYRDARGALDDARRQMQHGAHGEAVRTLEHRRERVSGLLGSRGVTGEIEAQLQQARQAEAAQDLHQVAERLRFLPGAETYSVRDLQTLNSRCRDAWNAVAKSASSAGALDPATEAQARTDLRDLALFWADLQRQMSAGRDTEGLSELEQLLSSFPPASDADTRGHLRRGLALLRSADLDRAAEELARATELHPQDFWANFYRGVCAYRRKKYDDAVHSFDIAIALMPESAEVYYNRALAFAGCDNPDRALRDYDRALALAPGLAVAALNRGVLHYQAGRHIQAWADLEKALADGADPATVHYNLALVHLALRDDTSARQHLRQALNHHPAHPQARALWERLARP